MHPNRETMIPGKPANPQTGLVVLTMLGVVAVLHLAKDVLAPVALALMLAFLLAPLVSRVERWGASRPVAVALTTFVAFTLIGGVVYTVANQFVGLIQDLPSHRDNLSIKIKSLPGTGGGGIERSVETVKELNAELQKVSPGKANAPNIAKVQIVEPPPNAAQVVRSLFDPLVGPASTAAIVVAFVLFMLILREDMRDRLVRLLGAGRMHTTIAALDEAGQRVSRYLLMQTLVNTNQGTLVAAGLYAIGVPDALLWGALTIVLRFIPYLGPMLAAAGPIALSVAVSAGWSEPLMVAGLIVTLELITNNVLKPRLYGASVRRVVVRADHRRGVLDLALGHHRTVPGHAADGVPGGDGQVHPAAGVRRGDPQRPTGARAKRSVLPAAARQRFGRSIGHGGRRAAGGLAAWGLRHDPSARAATHRAGP